MQDADNNPIETFIVVALCWWCLWHLESWRQGATRFPWTSEWPVRRDPLHHGERVQRIYSFPQCLREEGGKQINHQCLQEAPTHTDHYLLHYCLHHHLKLKSGIADCPPSQSWMDLQTGFCFARWKEACPECLAGKWLPRTSSCGEAEKEARCFLELRPKARLLLPYIKGVSKINSACRPLGIQAIFTSRNTLMKSERKTGNNGCEGSRVLDSLCRMLSYLSIACCLHSLFKPGLSICYCACKFFWAVCVCKHFLIVFMYWCTITQCSQVSKHMYKCMCTWWEDIAQNSFESQWGLSNVRKCLHSLSVYVCPCLCEAHDFCMCMLSYITLTSRVPDLRLKTASMVHCRKRLTTYGSMTVTETNFVRVYSSFSTDNYGHDTNKATGVKITTSGHVWAHLAFSQC